MKKILKRDTNIRYIGKISKLLCISSIMAIITCCYGESAHETVILKRWNHLNNAKGGCDCISKCHSKGGSTTSEGDTFGTYTLNSGKNYRFENDISLPNMSILVIPENTTFTNEKRHEFKFFTRSRIENNGIFTNLGRINILGGRSRITNNEIFINDGEIYIDGPFNSLTLLGDKSIVNKKMLCLLSGTLLIGAFRESPKGITIVNEGTPAYTANISIAGHGSIVIDSGSTLSFGAFSSFYSDVPDNSVTLSGSLQVSSKDANIDTKNFVFSGSGTIDLSPLSEYQEADFETLNLGDYKFNDESDKSLPNVILPFNCKFNKVKLSHAESVSYTVLKVDGWDIYSGIISKLYGTYGDYANDASLGVDLPSDASKVHVTTKTRGNVDVDMRLSALVENTAIYNRSPFKLLTDDLDEVTHNISKNTEYNFGFIGSNVISITGNAVVVFKGDNRSYKPDTAITLPHDVEFGASNSLFQFSQSYGHVTFTSGSNLSNEVAKNAKVEFTQGFNLGKGHVLTVSGILIG